MKTHKIFWWNLENLFDKYNSSRRSDWLKKLLGNELNGWTEEIRDQKIRNIASIIGKADPDLMGFCEIENKYMVELLMKEVKKITGKDYVIMHDEAKDRRGIDISIVYSKGKYMDDGLTFSLEIMKRSSTRDLFQVNLTTVDGNELIVIGNHWPARINGQFESEPYRIMVGETLSYWVERIHEIKGDNVAILIMGDFNDEPFSRSITDYLLASPNKKKVLNSRNTHFLFNPMYTLLGGEWGTYVYGSEITILDQFMVSKGILQKAKFSISQVRIVDFPELVSGRYNTPVKFGRPGESGFNPNGFSDHLPIELILEEKTD